MSKPLRVPRAEALPLEAVPKTGIRQATRSFRRRWLLVLLPCVAVAAMYALCPIFTFPTPRPFSGAFLYNPYAGLPGPWLRANFHAHSAAWGWITSGQGTPEQLAARYRRLHYNIGAISNYQRIDSVPGWTTIPGYEQGYNASKTHLLAIGATRVDWLDYVLFQGPNEKQERITRLARDGALVVIAHPQLRDAFSAEDMTRLSGYTALEVTSHFGQAGELWDAALGAGHAVWAIGDDDTHDASDGRQTGHSWTMVNARSTARADVLDAIRSGHTYAIFAANPIADVTLDQLRVTGDTIQLTLAGRRANVEFIGQGARRLRSLAEVRSARYIIPADEPYVRIVVTTPWTRLLLNPVIRYDGRALPVPVAKPNLLETLLLRCAAAGVALGAIWWLLPRHGKFTPSWIT